MSDATRMDLKSADVAEEKRAAMKRCIEQTFPEGFADGAIDFDQLRRALGEWMDPGKERFGLHWPGKADCMKIIQQPSVATLRPVRAESVKFDETENLFIEGDNLEVLKLLQKAYFGKIKMIYIDPPYNTGNEFIYPDRFAETLETYLAYTGQIGNDGRRFSTNSDTTGRYHSNWLNMMYPRLYLARNLLRDDGVLFVSIDDHEARNLLAALNEIYGETNFVAQIVILSNPRGRQSEIVATSHEYVLVFAKDIDCLNLSGQNLSDNQLSEFKHSLPDGRRYRLRGLRHRGNESRRVDRPDMYFALYVNPSTKQVAVEPSAEFSEMVVPKKSTGVDGRWEWGRETAKERIHLLEGFLVERRNEWDVYQREFLEGDNGDERRTKWKSMWLDKEINYQNGKNELKELFGECPVDYPKPLALLRKLIEGATSDSDIVLDFFAGSGTTGHATVAANLADGGKRRFVLVQLPEPCSPDSEAGRLGLKTIAEICRTRLVRSFESMGEETFQKLDLGGDGAADLGLRMFRLDRSNFRTWNANATENEELSRQIELHIDHLSESSSAEDVLYELLLKAGFPLATKVAEIELAGKQVFSIGEGALLICLEKEITPELIDAVAEANPLQVICLDEGFKGNDQLKANAVQTFKARAQADESEIVFRTV
jgi:adenine-specific DNA-methyltransferase